MNISPNKGPFQKKRIPFQPIIFQKQSLLVFEGSLSILLKKKHPCLPWPFFGMFWYSMFFFSTSSICIDSNVLDPLCIWFLQNSHWHLAGKPVTGFLNKKNEARPGPDALDLHRPAPTGAGAGTDAPANTWSTGAELVGETPGDMEMAVEWTGGASKWMPQYVNFHRTKGVKSVKTKVPLSDPIASSTGNVQCSHFHAREFIKLQRWTSLIVLEKTWGTWDVCKNHGTILNPNNCNNSSNIMTRWWFQIFFNFTLTWRDDPIWRAYFFKWVGSTIN